jgi:ABC-2 type transport system permease protein
MRGGLRMPFETNDEVIMAGGQVERTAMQAHAFCGMAVQFILFGAIEAAVGLLTERQRGQWNRIRAAPVAKRELLLGKTLSTAIVGLLTTIIVFLFGWLFFHIRVEGSLLGFGLVALAYALASATFGLLVAALGKSPQAARGISILVVLMMVMLGGAWMPSFLFPRWLQSATVAIPTRWAVDGFDGTLWRGLSLIETLPAIGALCGFAALFGAIAAWRFRWSAD